MIGSFFIDWADKDQAQFAIILLELDNLNQISDDFGKDVGGFLLQQSDKRLRECMGDQNPMVKLEGNRFAIRLVGVKKKEDAFKEAEKILTCIKEPLMFEKYKFVMGCSVGIALYPEHGRIMQTLIYQADRALYAVKKSGGGIGWPNLEK